MFAASLGAGAWTAGGKESAVGSSGRLASRCSSLMGAGAGTEQAYLYWTINGVGLGGDGTALGRANLDGSGTDQAWIRGATLYSGATGIAVDAAHIYWTDGNRYPQGRPAGTKLVPGTKRTLRLVLKPKKPKRKR